MKQSRLEELRQEIEQIPVIDTHEHLLPPGWTADKGANHFSAIREMKKGEEVNLSFILNNSYCGWERREVIQEKWASLDPFLDKVRGRAFYRSLYRALQRLYDFEAADITRENWLELSRRITAASGKQNWYRTILKERANIDLIIWDQHWKMGQTQIDREIFRPIFRIDPFLIGCNRTMLSHDGISPYSYAEELGCEIRSFDDYLDFIAFTIEKNKCEGSVGIKCAIAYERSIDFQPRTKKEAEAAFDLPEGRLSAEAKKAFGDYIMHFIVKQAIHYNLPLQIHTGMAMLEGSSPLNLVGLISRYPDARFVLFHGGYPWTSEVCAIAFTYHNVYLDLVWLPLLSPEVAVRTLHEWIDMVDADRLTWGGDCWIAEEVYGALVTGREVISHTLVEKIERGHLTQQVALDIARKILKDNAAHLYNVGS